jgi:hypothetical protein
MLNQTMPEKPITNRDIIAQHLEGTNTPSTPDSVAPNTEIKRANLSLFKPATITHDHIKKGGKK